MAGYGCVALQPLRRGEELFRVPRAACLGATSAGADADVTDGDCQRRLALALLEATADWAPFLAMLTPARCPWVWSESERRQLDGTELEPVVEAKLRALAEEHASLPQAVAEACGAERYAELCALAASHANPWWGGCIAPFNTTLNWARRPNVSFEPRGSKWVVGVATRRIRAGEELTQAYGGATADLVYRCGFAPPPAAEGEEGGSGSDDSDDGDGDDVVQVSLGALARAVHAASGGGGEEGGGEEGGVARLVRERSGALERSGAVEPSPWDGVDQLTFELGPRGEGTARLVGAALLLLAPEAEWRRAVGALDAGGAEGGAGDDDRAAAALLGGVVGASESERRSLARVGEEEGGEEGDPWPSLLHAALLGGGGRRAVMERARQVAAAAVADREAALGLAPTMSRLQGVSAEVHCVCSRLRACERSVLRSAADALSAPPEAAVSARLFG